MCKMPCTNSIGPNCIVYSRKTGQFFGMLNRSEKRKRKRRKAKAVRSLLPLGPLVKWPWLWDIFSP